MNVSNFTSETTETPGTYLLLQSDRKLNCPLQHTKDDFAGAAILFVVGQLKSSVSNIALRYVKYLCTSVITF